jgi:4-aminobutyrate aminotransferase
LALLTSQPGVFTVPFPYWHSLGVPASTPQDELVRLAIYQLELLFKTQTAPTDVAAIFIEPVIGEGLVFLRSSFAPSCSQPSSWHLRFSDDMLTYCSGYVPAPPAYLRALRSLCDKHGILLVVDEVQTGFGRTGKMFATEHTADLKPDVMVFAKGLANGFPLSGVVSRKDLMDQQEVGSIVS